MKLIYQPIVLLFVTVLLSACNGTSPTEIPIISVNPSETPLPQASATPPPFPTFTPTNTPIYQSPEPAKFPFGTTLNDALPRENLILAVHIYADTVGHIQSDDVCYDAGIYTDGSYIVISCMPGFTYPAPVGTLDANQSKYLQRWVKTFRRIEEPSMQGVLKFNGAGEAVPEYSDLISMQALLGELEWAAHEYVHTGGYPSAVFRAREVLSHQLNKWLDNSSILKFEVVDFPDSCLGAPKPNEICENIITQGFRIYFVANDMMYEYHTDAFGYDIRSFGEPQIAPTQGAGG